MTRRRLGLSLVALLVVAPVIGAALHRAHVGERRRSLARAAATAWQRTDYTGRIAWAHARAPHRARGTAATDGAGRPAEGESGDRARPGDEAGDRGPSGERHAREDADRRGRRDWSVSVAHAARDGRTEYGMGRREVWTLSGPSSRFPDPAGWCLDVAAMQDNYRATDPEDTTFLGRPARRFRLEPVEPGRPTVELTVDAGSDLPLKVSTFRADGSLYRVAAFREFAPEAPPLRSRPDRRSGDLWGDPMRLDRVAERIDFDPMLPDYLPAGFRRTECRVQKWVTPRLRLTWSDGVTVFELEQSRVPTPAETEHALRRRMSPERAERVLAWIRARQLRRIAASEPGDGRDGALVRCDRGWSHLRYEMHVGDLEVKLTARADLDPDELVKVLRSLRAR